MHSSLSHTPDFELPNDYPHFPEELTNLIEMNFAGLCRITISKYVSRGKYHSIATVYVQEKPARTQHPEARPEEIAEYCMACIGHEILENDDPGKYRVMVYGPPGKGTWKYSTHVDLTDPSGDARTVNMMNEAELTEQMGGYIGELHTAIVSMIETVNGVVKPLMQENKDMMRIVSESQKRISEVEAVHLEHAWRMRLHEDEQKREEMEQEGKTQRWNKLYDLVKDTNAMDALAQMVLTKVGMVIDDDEDELESPQEEAEKQEQPKAISVSAPRATRPNPSQGADDNEQKMRQSIQDKINQSPLVVAAEALKMSIDEKRQWGTIYKILNEEQAEIFDEIVRAETDAQVKKAVKKLASLKNMKALKELQSHLDEHQKTFVKILVKSAKQKSKK